MKNGKKGRYRSWWRLWSDPPRPVLELLWTHPKLGSRQLVALNDHDELGFEKDADLFPSWLVGWFKKSHHNKMCTEVDAEEQHQKCGVCDPLELLCVLKPRVCLASLNPRGSISSECACALSLLPYKFRRVFRCSLFKTQLSHGLREQLCEGFSLGRHSVRRTNASSFARCQPCETSKRHLEPQTQVRGARRHVPTRRLAATPELLVATHLQQR